MYEKFAELLGKSNKTAYQIAKDTGIAQSVLSDCIVKVHVFVDGFLQFLKGMKLLEVVHFRFENPPEALHRAVVDAAAGSGHGTR